MIANKWLLYFLIVFALETRRWKSSRLCTHRLFCDTIAGRGGCLQHITLPETQPTTPTTQNLMSPLKLVLNITVLNIQIHDIYFHTRGCCLCLLMLKSIHHLRSTFGPCSITSDARQKCKSLLYWKHEFGFPFPSFCFFPLVIRFEFNKLEMVQFYLLCIKRNSRL